MNMTEYNSLVTDEILAKYSLFDDRNPPSFPPSHLDLDAASAYRMTSRSRTNAAFVLVPKFSIIPETNDIPVDERLRLFGALVVLDFDNILWSLPFFYGKAKTEEIRFTKKMKIGTVERNFEKSFYDLRMTNILADNAE